MSLVQAIILAIIQGLTEFLPVSSSAHLVLVPSLLGWAHPSVTFDIAVHLGTLLALVIYFAADIVKLFRGFLLSLRPKRTRTLEERAYGRLSWLIVLGTIPIIVIGLLFKGWIESTFQSVIPVIVFLLITGVYLAIADVFSFPRKSNRELSPVGALLIGVAQAVALLPGISRSGATISTGLLIGLRREEAARFAFLLSIPAILGASVLEFSTLSLAQFPLGTLLLAAVVACGVGVLCIHFFLRLIVKTRLIWFAIYCWLFAFFALGMTFFG